MNEDIFQLIQYFKFIMKYFLQFVKWFVFMYDCLLFDVCGYFFEIEEGYLSLMMCYVIFWFFME